MNELTRQLLNQLMSKGTKKVQDKGSQFGDWISKGIDNLVDNTKK
jgi:hypothetical protein